MVVQPKVTKSGIQYSVHACPKQHSAEIQAVFPGLDVADLLVIPTCQHSTIDLVGLGEAVEKEKDELLEKFVAFGKKVCSALQAEGYWADYIDPCSGLPMVHQLNGGVYSEVDGLATLMNYKTSNAGCCKILLHPAWGSYVYPASLFAKAPLDAVEQAIAALD